MSEFLCWRGIMMTRRWSGQNQGRVAPNYLVDLPILGKTVETRAPCHAKALQGAFVLRCVRHCGSNVHGPVREQ